jgi:hypothetical protein
MFDGRELPYLWLVSSEQLVPYAAAFLALPA